MNGIKGIGYSGNKKLDFIGVFGGALIFAITVWLAFLPRTVPTPAADPYPEATAQNATVLQKCLDWKVCVGGFVKWRNDRNIYRIGGYEFTPHDYTVQAGMMRGRAERSLQESAQAIETIVLRSDDHEAWDAMAVRHAEQYIPK